MERSSQGNRLDEPALFEVMILTMKHNLVVVVAVCRLRKISGQLSQKAQIASANATHDICCNALYHNAVAVRDDINQASNEILSKTSSLTAGCSFSRLLRPTGEHVALILTLETHDSHVSQTKLPAAKRFKATGDF